MTTEPTIIRKSNNILILILCLSQFLVGCSEESEEDRLAKFRNSIKYKTYKFAIDNATKIFFKEYNKSNNAPIDEQFAHSTLGISHFLSGNSEWSFIEADTIEKYFDKKSKALSLGLKTVALSKMKYPKLSKAAYQELKALLPDLNLIGSNSIEMDHKILLFSLIIVGLYENEPSIAKSSADALGAISELDYLSPLVGVIAETKNGSPINAMEQLNELNKSEKFSEKKKMFFKEVKEVIASSEKKGVVGKELGALIEKHFITQVCDEIFNSEGKIELLKSLKELPELIKENTKPGEKENNLTTPHSTIIGTWHCSYDGGGDTMVFSKDTLLFTFRTFTAEDTEVPCTWKIEECIIYVTKKENILKFRLVQHENATFLVSDDYFKQYSDKLPDFIFQNSFKKVK